MNELLEKINMLPPDLSKEVDDFVTFLIERNKPKEKRKIKSTLIGALKEFKSKYTSVEMQHKIQQEWDEHVSS